MAAQRAAVGGDDARDLVAGGAKGAGQARDGVAEAAGLTQGRKLRR